MVFINNFYSMFIGIWILIEGTYGNNNTILPEHFQFVKKNYGSVFKLGNRRFQKIFGCLDPTIEEIKELCDMISESSQK